MSNNQPRPNNDIQYEPTGYKHRTCAGLRCNNVPMHYLKITLIKKSGWFYDSCKHVLEKYNLLESDLAIDAKIGIEDLKTLADVK